MSYSNCTLIIPTLNEEESIGKTLDTVISLYPMLKIVVVDDGSKDKTKLLIKAYTKVTLIDREHRNVHGITASVIDAIMQITTDYFIVMDADLQHPPEKINEIYRHLVSGFDLIIARRDKLPENWSIFRKTESNIANLFAKIRLLTRDSRIRDPISGFFGGTTKQFQKTIRKNRHRFVDEGYKVLLDYLKSAPNYIKIDTIPYTFKLREQGTSKIGSRQIIAFLKSLLT